MLRLVADGRTAGEIATQLFISSRTAEHHIQNIYTKIGVSSRAAATRWAVKHQVVDGAGDGRSAAAGHRVRRRKWVGLPMPLRRPIRRMTLDAGRTRPARSGSEAIHAERGDCHDPGNDDRRERRPIPGGVRHEGRRQACASTAPRVRRCSATPPRRTASGRCSTGTSRGGPTFVSDPDVPPILKEAGHLGKPEAALLLGSYGREEATMTSAINRPARVGLITDQTGALSFMGIANVNVAKMVIDDINARGGLLGRPVELFVEDSATDDERGRSRRGEARRGPTSTSSWAASTAPPDRPSRDRWSTRPRSSTSTRSSTRVRSVTP